MATQRFTTFDVTDWTVATEDAAVRFTPSGTAVGRSLWVTALAVVIVIVMALVFGFPPGSKQVSAQRGKVDALRQQVETLDRQSRRLRAGVGDTARVMAQQAEQRAQQLRQALQQEEAALARMTPTLGPAGDAAYWSVAAVVLAVGVLSPLSGLWTRASLRLEGDELVMHRSWLPRTWRADTSDLAAMVVTVRRLATRHRETGQVDDHGWLWSLLLIPDPAAAATGPLEIRLELSTIMPPRAEDLTGQVRPVARWIQQQTGIPVSEVLSTDVKAITADALSTRYAMKTHRHGPGRTAPRHDPLQ